MIKVSDLFYIKYGNSLALNNLSYADDEYECINFISRTSQDNGVVAKVKSIQGINPFRKGLITVAVSGSVLETFVQVKEFYTSYHILVLEPKQDMLFCEKQFYAMCIRANKYRYNYGRQANKTLKNIELPLHIPEWVYEFNGKPQYLKSSKKQAVNLSNVNEWKEYSLTEFFDMYSGNYYSKDSFQNGDIPLISSSNDNNGCKNMTNLEPIFPKGCLTIGKIGAVTFYQNKPFCATSDVTVLIPKKNFNINQHIGIFLQTIINQEKIKWSYGRQIRLNDCKKLMIKLPYKNSSAPDWEYIENYIKSLSYSEYI